MYYSLVCFLALSTLLILNHDVFFGRDGGASSRVQRVYRRLMYGFAAYFIVDMLWGLLDYFALTSFIFAETSIYYAVLAVSVLVWTQYAAEYLEQKNAFQKFLLLAGQIFFIGAVGLMLVNLAYPILFWFDEKGVYQAGPARYALLIAIMLMLLLTVIYSLRYAARTEGSVRGRHFTIGLSGLIMLFFVSIQTFFPLLPLYSVAYMLGCCLIRTFVVDMEKEEYRQELELALENEKRHLQELKAARRIAFTDPLTGIRSKGAYVYFVKQLEERLSQGEQIPFALVMFDCNYLKQVNDRYGHSAGDEYLKAAAAIMSRSFPESPVFRIGGDEFATVLMGAAFANREKLIAEFKEREPELFLAVRIRENFLGIAVGSAVFDPRIDSCVDDVLRRADQNMYGDKRTREQS